jgi:hypothetical protein
MFRFVTIPKNKKQIIYIIFEFLIQQDQPSPNALVNRVNVFSR